MEYCCYVWTDASSSFMNLLDKLPKQICRTVGSSLAASLTPLAHLRNVASLSLFYRYYFRGCLSELTQLFPLPYSCGRCLLVILIDWMIFLWPFLDVTRISHTTRLWNSLPIECFLLNYDLNGYMSRIRRHLFNCRFFLKRFPVCFNHFVLLFLVTPCLLVAV